MALVASPFSRLAFPVLSARNKCPSEVNSACTFRNSRRSSLASDGRLCQGRQATRSVGISRILHRSPHGTGRRNGRFAGFHAVAQLEPLDMTEENIEQVLLEARTELLQIFDETVGITGVVELADLDGPYVTLRLKGRFWHQRSVVLARLANFLQQRIPEILDVTIEDSSQLDDSPSNF